LDPSRRKFPPRRSKGIAVILHETIPKRAKIIIFEKMRNDLSLKLEWQAICSGRKINRIDVSLSTGNHSFVSIEDLLLMIGTIRRTNSSEYTHHNEVERLQTSLYHPVPDCYITDLASRLKEIG
jgi:hypothetical protein